MNTSARKGVLPTVIPFPLEKELLADVVPSAKDFALLNGAGMRYMDKYNPEILEMAPFFLFPSVFPKRDFDSVIKSQPTINLLMHNIAHDYDFLYACLKNTIEVDDFTARLWKIYETVRKEGVAQSFSLGAFRSDYFTCETGQCAKQVEVNTIAASFGGLSITLRKLHSYVLSYIGKPELLKNIPKNNALEQLCHGMTYAWDLYNAQFDEPRAVILFLVEEITYNICDQRFHEYQIRKCRPEIQVVRKTFKEVYDKGKLTADKKLIVDGLEVAVVYFRCGYEPNQYPTEKEWDARLKIERSVAIKSPSIHYHLAGAKKVQQEMSRPGVVERYIPNEMAAHIRTSFTGLYSLDMNEEGDKAVEMGITNPKKYVLKPQREGGGNNIYGDEIKEVLLRIRNSKERESYILMDRIYAPIQENYVVRGGKDAVLEDVVSELGIFGVIVGTKDEILMNNYAGHMLRTKLSSEDEGGVSHGEGALDSVYLI